MSENPLRIVLLNDLLPPDSEGGLELSAFEIGSGLRSLGHDVQFVCSEWRPSFTGERRDPDHIHRLLSYEEARPSKRPGPAGKIESFRSIQRKINVGGKNYGTLCEWLKANGPFDVALVFGILGVGLGVARAFTDLGIPIVWSMGDVSIPVHFGLSSQTKLYRLAFNTVGRKWHAVEKTVDFSHILFTSDFVRRENLKVGIDPKEWQVIPRAIDFKITPPESLEKERPPSMLVACRLSPSRGVHVAIQAAEQLAERRPDLDWRLKIAGSGAPDYVNALMAQAKPLGNRVVFLGKLGKPDLLAVMRSATIVLNPTVEVEGFGRTNIEAMACGAALLATDIPSIHEIVISGVSAEIVPPGDAEAMSAAMETLLTDTGHLCRLVSAAHLRVLDSYTLPPVLGAIEGHIRKATHAHRHDKTTSD